MSDAAKDIGDAITAIRYWDEVIAPRLAGRATPEEIEAQVPGWVDAVLANPKARVGLRLWSGEPLEAAER